MVPAALRPGHLHDQAPAGGPKIKSAVTRGESLLLTSGTWLQRTGPRRADTPRETTSWTRKVRSRVSALYGCAIRSCAARLPLTLRDRKFRHGSVQPGRRVGWCVWPGRQARPMLAGWWFGGLADRAGGGRGAAGRESRPRAMDTAAPESSSAATAGRLAISRVACWSGVRWSAERSRTTEGRVAPDTASSSPKSVSAEMITRPELAA